MGPLPSSTTLPLVSSSTTINSQTLNSTLSNNLNQSTSIITTNQSQSKNLIIENEIDPNQISSPLELIGWVDSVLSKLETKFSRIELDVLDRLDLLGKRIDSLETSMSELMEGSGGGINSSSVPSTATLNSELSPISGPTS